MATITQVRHYDCSDCTAKFRWEIGRDEDGLPYILIAVLVEDREILRATRRYFHEAYAFMKEWHDDCKTDKLPRMTKWEKFTEA